MQRWAEVLALPLSANAALKAREAAADRYRLDGAARLLLHGDGHLGVLLSRRIGLA
jgi:hypothetical protein